MGWFENQIEERRAADQQILEESFVKIAGVVLGQRMANKISDERIVTKGAIDEILKYYHCKPVELPEKIRTTDEQLDHALRPHGLMRRNVVLTESWYRDAYGPMLAFTKEDGLPVALLPGTIMGYTYTDPRTGRREKLNAKTATLFGADAVCCYRPLPQKKLGIPDLLLYMKRCLSLSDTVITVGAALAVTLTGLLLPKITQAITGPVLSSGRSDALIGIVICLVCVLLSTRLCESISTLLQSRLNTKISLGVEASMMMRLLSLPASFFRRYSPGELQSRSDSVNQLCSTLLNMVMNTGLSSLTSLLYVGQCRTNFPLRSRAGGALPDRYSRYGGLLRSDHPDAGPYQSQADGAGRQGIRHDLRADQRCTEDQAGRRGKACLCQMAGFICRGRGDDL